MRTDLTSRRAIVLQVIKWVSFALLIWCCFLSETSGSYVKPLLLIPAALCISSHTGEIQATAVGMVCGMLLDIACDKLLGYNAVWMVICCVAVSLLHRYYLREKLLNTLALTLVCTALQSYLDFIFYYAIWDHDDVTLVYTRVMIPSGIMTVAAAIPMYFLIGWINRRCGSRLDYELEKTIIRKS